MGRIVGNTSALITIASIDSINHVLSEDDVHTTKMVIQELEETAAYEDIHGQSAQDVLNQVDRIDVHSTSEPDFQSSRIDEGEGTIVVLANEA